MIKIRHILLMLIVMLLASCTNDDLTQEKGQVVKVRVPITLITGQPMTETTRAIGDPGYDDKLPPTQYLYVWAIYQKSGGTYAVTYRKLTLNNSDWEYTTGTTGTENQDSKYTTSVFELEIEADKINAGENVGKVYVIASNKELSFSDTNLSSWTDWNNSTNAAYWTNGNCTSDPNGSLSSLTFTPPTTPPANWTSNDLRDLYSNPISASETDDNGVIKKEGNVITVGTIRLYHCAAKVDFKWEVAENLRSTTSVASITCTGLPTTLKVFAPTNNQAPTAPGASCIVLGTDDNAVNALTIENKYIGRACAYVLQPASGAINYSVTFIGKANKSTTIEATSASIYTSWYRVVAEVNP